MGKKREDKQRQQEKAKRFLKKKQKYQPKPLTKPTPISKPAKPKVKPGAIVKTNARIPYTKEQEILVVGDGNLSFSLALVKLMNGVKLTTTTFDDKDTLKVKYEQVEEIIEELKESGVKVLHGIDATMLQKTALKGCLFDCIIFNFPHAGLISLNINFSIILIFNIFDFNFFINQSINLGKGIKDQERNIHSNQLLIDQFLQSAMELLKPKGQVHITLKTGQPYDSWNTVKIARNLNYDLKDCIVFDPNLYPGYTHRRTLGFKEGVSKDNNIEIKAKTCKTYMFIIKAGENKKKRNVNVNKNKKKVANDDDDDSD